MAPKSLEREPKSLRRTGAAAGLVGGIFLTGVAAAGILKNTPDTPGWPVKFGETTYVRLPVEANEEIFLPIGFLGLVSVGVSIYILTDEDEPR